MGKSWRRGKFSTVAIILQLVMLALFAIFVEYDSSADPRKDKSFYQASYKRQLDNMSSHDDHGGGHDQPTIAEYYPFFQDVHVMMFVGFGFLMTFMRRYSFSSLGFNFLIASFVIQWACLMAGFLHLHDGKILINMYTLLTSDFAAAAVLITFGAVLGRTSPLQLLVMSVLEIVVFQVNEWLGLSIFKAIDVGGSMFVHVFGAYFGCAVAAVIYYKDEVENAAHKERPVYDSDLFSLIGTLFLWMCWPSFNAALAPGDDKLRAVLNTYFALASCTVITFAFSILTSKEDKIDIEHIQNSTLAGGVAVGTVADLNIHPWGAIVIGIVSAIVSCLGFTYVSPWMANKLRIHDSCGVNNLHGMPGIIAGIAGIIMAAMASEELYGASLYQIYPAMAPKNGTAEWDAFHKKYTLEAGDGRTPREQALWQLCALGVTIGMSIVGGIITGLVLRLPIWNRPHQAKLFEDTEFWEVPDGYPPEPPRIEERNEKTGVVLTNDFVSRI